MMLLTSSNVGNRKDTGRLQCINKNNGRYKIIHWNCNTHINMSKGENIIYIYIDIYCFLYIFFFHQAFRQRRVGIPCPIPAVLLQERSFFLTVRGPPAPERHSQGKDQSSLGDPWALHVWFLHLFDWFWDGFVIDVVSILEPFVDDCS